MTVIARRYDTDHAVEPEHLPEAVDDLGRGTTRLAVAIDGRELRVVPITRRSFSLDLVAGDEIRTATVHDRRAVLEALRAWAQDEPTPGWDGGFTWSAPRAATATPARATDWQQPVTAQQWWRSRSTYPMSTMELIDGRLHTSARGAPHDEAVDGIAAALRTLRPEGAVAVREPLVIDGDGYVPDLVLTVAGTVDTIVEVATKETLATDLREKARTYWGRGVRRYLVVDERTGATSVHARTQERWATRFAFLQDPGDLDATVAVLGPLLDRSLTEPPDHQGATP